MRKTDDYKPRHKSVVNKEFCKNGCQIIDDIKVPFPDCFAHGNPFTLGSKCAIIRSLPPLKS